MSAPAPRMCTGRIALVCGVTAASTFVASKVSVSSMSQNTGTAPRWITALIVATQVYVGTITSSPGPTPRAASEVMSAPVPDVTPTACLAPIASANARSSCVTLCIGRGP